MNNLNLGTFTHFGSITWQPTQDHHDCFGNSAKIVKRLPIWLNNQPFWTYQCLCCSVYKFEKGKTGSFADWGGIYD